MGKKKVWKRPKYPKSSKQEYPPCPTSADIDPSIYAEVESLFKKFYTYKTEGEDWILPSKNSIFTSEPWSDYILQEYKETLNNTKCSLSDKDINQWHEHTQFTNRAGSVIYHVKRTRKPELCTQAWCKFYEILGTFPILPVSVRSVVTDELVESVPDETNPFLHTVHICEAPGAFIASLNHYLKTRGYHREWRWTANTLNPYYEGNDLSKMITDDRLILDTLPNWHFGPDDSGDILHPENIRSLQEHVLKNGHAHLVTCDGSIDCQNQPDLQETLVAPLHLAEVTSSLLLLAPGGSLVLKMFTLFETSSVCLMYLLNCCFDKVHVFKPATSKSGNSEVYVICVGYKGCSVEITEQLLDVLGKSVELNSMFRKDDIPHSYLEEHRRCCEVFMRFQTQTIEENLSLFSCMTSDQRSHLTLVKHHCSSSYVQRFNIRSLPSQAYLVPPFFTVNGQSYTKTHQQRSRKCHSGSYTDRQKQLGLSWQERVTRASPYGIGLQAPGWFKSESELESENVSQWPIVCGLPPESIVSSQFCEPAVLLWYNELLTQHLQIESREKSSFDFGDLAIVLESLYPKPMDDTEDESLLIPLVHLDFEKGKLFSSLADSGQFKEALMDSTEGRLFVSGAEIPCEFLRAILKMYESVCCGDHCVFLVPHFLSRLYAGILYMLCASFLEVRVSFINSDPRSPVAIVGKSYKLSRSPPVLKWLQQLVKSVAQTEETPMTLLQITPIEVLFESRFYEYVCTCNETILKARSDYMLDGQRETFVKSLHDATGTENTNSEHKETLSVDQR